LREDRTLSVIDGYFTRLADAEYQPEKTADDEIRFESGGHTFTLLADAELDGFLSLTQLHDIEEDTTDVALFQAANVVNADALGTKCWIEFDEPPDEGASVVFAVETFYADPANFTAFLGKSMDQLDAAYDVFFGELRGERT
jgi:hypothetical protein